MGRRSRTAAESSSKPRTRSARKSTPEEEVIKGLAPLVPAAPAAPTAKPDGWAHFDSVPTSTMTGQEATRAGLAAYHKMTPAQKFGWTVRQLRGRLAKLLAQARAWGPTAEPVAMMLYAADDDLQAAERELAKFPVDWKAPSAFAGSRNDVTGKTCRIREKLMTRMTAFSPSTRFKVLDATTSPLRLLVVGTDQQVFLKRTDLEFVDGDGKAVL